MFFNQKLFLPQTITITTTNCLSSVKNKIWIFFVLFIDDNSVFFCQRLMNFFFSRKCKKFLIEFNQFNFNNRHHQFYPIIESGSTNESSKSIKTNIGVLNRNAFCRRVIGSNEFFPFNFNVVELNLEFCLNFNGFFVSHASVT